MIDWLKLTDEQRKITIDEAETEAGIFAKAIEKDWWVTLVLKALFQSKYKNYMVFKGGTSLSKGWGLINRFSEDIDIALSPEAFGFIYQSEPSGSYLKKLKKTGCLFTSNELLSEIKEQLYSMGLPIGTVTLWAQEVKEGVPDTDPQSLFVKYNSLYPPSNYIREEVKIEVSVRSKKTPYSKRPLQTLLNKINPREVYKETEFEVDIVEPKKTFLEKMFLLHEEFSKPDKNKIRTERMSRHLYDLSKMSTLSIANEALADHALYNDLISHRGRYTPVRGINYKTHHHSTISFLPLDEIEEHYMKDYERMLEEMIYETNADTFIQMIDKLKELQKRVRIKHETFPQD